MLLCRGGEGSLAQVVEGLVRRGKVVGKAGGSTVVPGRFAKVEGFGQREKVFLHRAAGGVHRHGFHGRDRRASLLVCGSHESFLGFVFLIELLWGVVLVGLGVRITALDEDGGVSV